MRPTHLHARNFRTYETLDVDLSAGGLTAILGEIRDGGANSNGAGKSSILEAVEIALFGRRSLAPYVRRGQPDDLLLELEFEHAGETYRVRRTFAQRGRGMATLDFEMRNLIALEHETEEAWQWQPLSRASMKETDALICDTIGLSRDTYRHSSYLRQQSRSFADESVEPRERKRLLTEAVLGRTPVWATRLEQARAEKSALTAKNLLLAGQIEQARLQAAMLASLERELEAVVEAETVSADNVADLERSHAELAAEYQAAREHASRKAAAVAELLQAQAALAGLDDRAARAAEATQTLSVARDELAGLPEYPPLDEIRARETVLLAAVEAHAQAVRGREAAELLREQRKREREALVAQAAEKRQREAQIERRIRELEAADPGDDHCELCKQPLGAAALTASLERLKEESPRLAGEAAALDAQASAVVIPFLPALPDEEPPTRELEVCRSAITAAASSETLRATLAERVAASERILDDQPSDDQVAAARAAVEAKSAAVAEVGEPPNLAAIEIRGNEVSEQLAGARASLEQHRTMRARLDERITVARAATKQLDDAQAERKTLEGSLDVVAALERAYHPDGVPALILENSAIPYLEVTANRILADLACPYTIELRTQAENKTGGLRDTLDVIVVDETGETALFEEGTSGGEKTRIGLALRIGLARLLGGSGMLALDEPGDLDEAGMAALVQVLRDLQDEFALILLVSHVPALRDSFDQVLTVVKTDGRSTVSDGYTAPVDQQAEVAA